MDLLFYASLSLGALKLATYLWSLSNFFFQYVLCKLIPNNLHSRYAKPGSWALITGVTDGIGKAMAHELADQGFNILVASRSPAKLQAVSAEIEKAHPGRKAKILQIDFSKVTSLEEYSKLLAPEFQALDIAMVVCCAGLDFPGFFHQIQAEEVHSILSVDMLHPVYMAKAAITHLEARTQKSCLMFVSSTMDCHPNPGFGLYSASKAFMSNFASALSVELKNIECVNYMPGPIATKLSGFPYIPFVILSPAQSARSSLHDCGRFERTNGTAVQNFIYFFQKTVSKYLAFVINKAMADDGQAKLSKKTA